jgi:membrane protease YdiL (CAAX protease family)
MTPSIREKEPRYALLGFFLLAYALSWWPSLVEAHGILPLGPLLAATLVLAFTAGRDGVKSFLARIVSFRVAPRWILLALGLPLALTAGAAGLNALFSNTAPAWERVPPLSDLPLTFVTIFLFIGLGEEPAWRGYALPRLLAGRPVLVGCFLLGLAHALWHLPLFGLEFDRRNGPPWFLGLLAFTVVTAWLYHRTSANLLLPSLMHASVNVSAKYLFAPLFSGADQVWLWWLFAALWWVPATIALVADGWDLGRARSETERTAYGSALPLAAAMGTGSSTPRA